MHVVGMALFTAAFKRKRCPGGSVGRKCFSGRRDFRTRNTSTPIFLPQRAGQSNHPEEAGINCSSKGQALECRHAASAVRD